MPFLDHDTRKKLEVLLPGFDEAFKAIFDLTPADWAVIIGGVLWLLILALSLKAVDRRDIAAGITYTLFMTFAGVVLLVALPARLQGISDLARQDLIRIVAMAAISSFRWFWHRTAPVYTAVDTSKQTEDPIADIRANMSRERGKATPKTIKKGAA